jgi:hypothetical protein
VRVNVEEVDVWQRLDPRQEVLVGIHATEAMPVACEATLSVCRSSS